jgi:hypothetical protein
MKGNPGDDKVIANTVKRFDFPMHYQFEVRNPMEHNAATEHHLVEQYLLNEMPPEVREEFEEHFFDCQVCAADVRATAAFLDAARVELKKPEFASRTQLRAEDQAPAKGRFWMWKPAAAFALAASLMVVVYQNAVVYPRLRSEVARLETPEILPTLSLVSGNSRGGAIPSVAVGSAHAMLLLVDIPAQDIFFNYTCLLYSPQHKLLWTGQVPAQQAKDTVSIRLPLGMSAGGTYSLLVKGNRTPDASSTAVNLANYDFSLNAGPVGPGQ